MSTVRDRRRSWSSFTSWIELADEAASRRARRSGADVGRELALSVRPPPRTPSRHRHRVRADCFTHVEGEGGRSSVEHGEVLRGCSRRRRRPGDVADEDRGAAATRHRQSANARGLDERPVDAYEALGSAALDGAGRVIPHSRRGGRRRPAPARGVGAQCGPDRPDLDLARVAPPTMFTRADARARSRRRLHDVCSASSVIADRAVMSERSRAIETIGASFGSKRWTIGSSISSGKRAPDARHLAADVLRRDGDGTPSWNSASRTIDRPRATWTSTS